MTDGGCEQCEENTFSSAGASSCTNCPAGMVSRAGSTSQSDCSFGKNSSRFDSFLGHGARIIKFALNQFP